MFHPSIPLYYPYLPWLNLKKELRRARLSAALTMPWSLRCQADCIWLSPKIKVGTYWNKWSKWVNLENFPHSVKFMSIHVKFTLLHHTAHQISSDSFSACRFYQLIPEPAEPLTFSKAGEHQAAAWSRVPCAHSYPALPESQNVGLVNFGSRTSGQDGPRCAEMGQNCGSIFESTHNLSVRIRIDSSFQQTAIYLSSATLSLALVLIYLYVVERCWGHQSKILSKSCS